MRKLFFALIGMIVLFLHVDVGKAYAEYNKAEFKAKIICVTSDVQADNLNLFVDQLDIAPVFMAVEFVDIGNQIVNDVIEATENEKSFVIRHIYNNHKNIKSIKCNLICSIGNINIKIFDKVQGTKHEAYKYKNIQKYYTYALTII